MTAPDPRLNEIQSRLDAAEKGPWFLDADGVSIYYVFHNGDTLDRDRLAESSGDDAILIANTPADIAYLLAELRKAREALGRVEAVATDLATRGAAIEAKGYNGSINSNIDEGRSIGYLEGARLIRAAVAAAKGDGQ